MGFSHHPQNSETKAKDRAKGDRRFSIGRFAAKTNLAATTMRLTKRQMRVLRIIAAVGAVALVAQWALQQHQRRQIGELRIANQTRRSLRVENHALRKAAGELERLRRDDVEFAQLHFETLAWQTKLEAAAIVGPVAGISAPRPSAAFPSRTKISTDVMPRPVAQPTPVYPASLRAQRIGGSVDVAVTVDRDGDVSDFWVASATRPEFEAAVVEAVRNWKYRPAKHGGEPAEATIVVLVQFDGEKGRVSVGRPVEVPSPLRVQPPPAPPDWF